MILPTAYLPPCSYMRDLLSEPVTIEQMETFEKQTFRNRCLIRDTKGQPLRLTVPVGKVEHKQWTRDIRISYQTKWQHQHWMALVSAYQHRPYWIYYADYLKPFYEKQYTWLLDFNDELTETLRTLIENNRPTNISPRVIRSNNWNGQTWTDKHSWQSEISIIDVLVEKGAETLTMMG